MFKNFFWSKNHFLENGYVPKIFINKFSWSKFFYGRKIISLKTGPYLKLSQNFFLSKNVLVAKLFPRTLVPSKNFHQNFLVKNFLWSQKNFLENGSLPKIFILNFCSKIFLWPQNHFLENVSQQNFSTKFFMVAKSLPRKLVPTKIFDK